MELEDKPIQFRRDTKEDFANDVDHLAVLGVDRAASHRAGCEEEISIFRFDQKPDRDLVRG